VISQYGGKLKKVTFPGPVTGFDSRFLRYTPDIRSIYFTMPARGNPVSAIFRTIGVSILFMAARFVMTAWLGITAPLVIAQQQDVETDVVEKSVVAKTAATDIEAKLEHLAQGIDNLQILAVQIANVATIDREALSYLRDSRKLELLSTVGEIAGLVAKLPESDPILLELETRWLEDLKSLVDLVYKRIDELDVQIQEMDAELESKKGTDLILADSILNNLESTRDQFIRAMVDHVDTVDSLGIDSEDLLPALKLRLVLQAETVAGRLVLLSILLKDIDQRLTQQKDDPDLLTARKQASQFGKHNLARLRELVILMARLDIPEAEYRALIARQSQGLSVEMIRPDVMTQVVVGRLDEAKSYILKQGPNILLNISVFLGILILFWLLSGIFRKIVELILTLSKWDISVLYKEALVKMAGIIFKLVGLLIALTQVGISLGPMLAGLGLASFIVGIALQDTLANFASGAMILIYRPYDLDDFIELPGAAGVVKKMTLVATTITTFNNQVLVIPNRKIWGDVIKNVTAQRVRRVDLTFGIGYSDDIELAERILAEAAAAHELILKSPATMIKVDSLGESSVNLVLRPWTKTEDYWTVYWDLTRDVKLRFDEAGIRFAFPQQDVHFYDKSRGS
jgi:small conductance mechanosensitive channel